MPNTNERNLPSNLIEIIESAANLFSDAAVVSVEAQTSFGMVIVFRDNTVKMA